MRRSPAQVDSGLDATGCRILAGCQPNPAGPEAPQPGMKRRGRQRRSSPSCQRYSGRGPAKTHAPPVLTRRALRLTMARVGPRRTPDALRSLVGKGGGEGNRTPGRLVDEAPGTHQGHPR